MKLLNLYENIAGQVIVAKREFSVKRTSAILAYSKYGVACLSIDGGTQPFQDIGANGWGEKRSRKYYYNNWNWDGMPDDMSSPYCDWNKKQKQEKLLAYFNEIKQVELLLKKTK